MLFWTFLWLSFVKWGTGYSLLGHLLNIFVLFIFNDNEVLLGSILQKCGNRRDCGNWDSVTEMIPLSYHQISARPLNIPWSGLTRGFLHLSMRVIPIRQTWKSLRYGRYDTMQPYFATIVGTWKSNIGKCCSGDTRLRVPPHMTYQLSYKRRRIHYNTFKKLV